MRSRANGHFRSERGQILPLVALSLAALLGCAALSVDAGYMRYQQRVQQAATDSAALSGAAQLAYSAASVGSVAQSTASTGGFTDDGTNTYVTVTNPPADGPYAGNSNAVDVVIKKKRPTLFAGVVGISNGWITTEAVGLLRPSTGPDCIYVLSNSGTTTVFNGANISMPTCGIIADNSLTSNGANVNASTIGVAGTIRSNGATYPEASPAPALQVTDPCQLITGCAYLRANPPSTTPCNYTNYLASGGSSVWLTPGVYCGTTTFSGVSTVNFNPGEYVFTGDIVSSGVKNFNGTGVTFVMTGSGSITFNGSDTNLTPPTSGDTAGMLFYAPNVTNATLNGGPGTMGGVVYFPKAQTTFNGASSAYYVLISNTLTVNGAISTAGPGSGGSYVREAVLAQ